jgi:hypothetical protein
MLLQGGPLSLAEVASQAGFCDQSQSAVTSSMGSQKSQSGWARASEILPRAGRMNFPALMSDEIAPVCG